ncbi:hypothetical protein, partial [Escherichia coli]
SIYSTKPVYDTNKVKSGALEATALINVKYD